MMIRFEFWFRASDRVSYLLAAIGGAIILFTVIPITLDVISRKLFNAAWFESYEISSYGFAVAVSLGYAHAFLAGTHIRVDIITRHLPTPLRALFDFVAVLSLQVVSAFLAIHAWETVAQSITLNAHSNSTLQLPLAIPQTLWAFGLSWFALVCFIVSCRLIYLGVSRRFEEIVTLVQGSEYDPDDLERLERQV
jgi:TRAP-type C4-dicarboxylate transport system permease small subunit